MEFEFARTRDSGPLIPVRRLLTTPFAAYEDKMADLLIRIGGDMAADAIADLRQSLARVEAGDYTDEKPVIAFADWQTFLSTFSEARIDLLRHLAETRSTPSIQDPRTKNF